MTYMIKISQTGEPKLVKVPEEQRSYCSGKGFNCCPGERCVRLVHEEKVASALADESKHISFKDKAQAFKIISDSNKGTLAQFAVASGQSFPLPKGLRVEFEYYYLGDNEYFKKDEPEENKWVGPVGKSGHEIHLMMGWKTKAVAVLLPEQPEEKKDIEIPDELKFKFTPLHKRRFCGCSSSDDCNADCIVPAWVAKRVLAARDAHIKGDHEEVWHQLYSIASPEFDKLSDNVWEDLEDMAKGAS